MPNGGWRWTNGTPEYPIAGSYTAFLPWRSEDPKVRARVTFLATAERAEGREPGVLHRIGTWETSPARGAAEGLEGVRG
jgi:hypothetical protein